jgi:RimJ/RimL family protein N-acetyltransferase
MPTRFVTRVITEPVEGQYLSERAVDMPRYTYVDGRRVIGEFTLSDLPGNLEVGVSHGTFIHPESRGKGIGQKQHAERLAAATQIGYLALICTVNATNLAEKHILTKNGWKSAWTFKNKDGDLVELFVRQLGE